MKRFVMALFVMISIPYVTTLAFTGRVSSGDSAAFFHELGQAGEKSVVVERSGREISIPVEEFLIHVLAAQIPAEYGMETLKAQAVLARTWIYRELNGGDRVYEEALDLDALSKEEMERLWGSRDFSENYGRLRRAVYETAGLTATWEGAYIEPFFCRAAAGSTRSLGEEYPYLKAAESPGDLEADGFLASAYFSERELFAMIRGLPGAESVAAEDLLSQIQIVEREPAGYVKQIQIGAKTYDGEVVSRALGLPSASYSFEESDGKIRVISKGIGHGYGFSQAGANALEREGYDFAELLHHYFQNIKIDERNFEKAE